MEKRRFSTPVNINNLGESRWADRYQCRRIFCYASPQAGVSTIPKEFVIDTSELRVVNTKPGQHIKSQGCSPVVKEGNLVGEDGVAVKGDRQVGKYKCSFWRLQQVKVNQSKKSQLIKENNSQSSLISPSSTFKRSKHHGGSSQNARQDLKVHKIRASRDFSAQNDDGPKSDKNSRNGSSIRPTGQMGMSEQRSTRPVRILYDNHDYYPKENRFNFHIKSHDESSFTGAGPVLSEGPSSAGSLAINGVSSNQNIYQKTRKIVEAGHHLNDMLPWKVKQRIEKVKLSSPSYRKQQRFKGQQMDYMYKAERIREQRMKNAQFRNTNDNLFSSTTREVQELTQEMKKKQSMTDAMIQYYCNK